MLIIDEKILVLTGVTGKSGEILAEKIDRGISDLFPDGIRIIVRATSDTKKVDCLIPNAEKFIGDLTDSSLLKNACKDADTVFHIAGVHYSRLVVQAAAECHVRRLILVHTTGIYSKHKAAGEEYRRIDDYVYKICKKNNILLTILRSTMIYGNISD